MAATDFDEVVDAAGLAAAWTIVVVGEDEWPEPWVAIDAPNAAPPPSTAAAASAAAR